MADTKWLDSDELRAWRSYIEATTRVRQACGADLQAQTGLIPDDYAILMTLSESPDRRCRMVALADRLATAPRRITYRVDRLEEMGYVCRETCPTDRRGSFATLTDAGMEALEQAAPIHAATVRQHLLDHLTRAEFLQVGKLLERVAEAHR